MWRANLLHKRPMQVFPAITVATIDYISAGAYGGDRYGRVGRSPANADFFDGLSPSLTGQPLSLIAFQAAKPLRSHE